MLHAAWDHNRLAVFGWAGRALDAEAVDALTRRLFAHHQLEATSHVTTLPGKRQPTTLHGVWVDLLVAHEAFTVFDWVPWRSLSPSLAWLVDVSALANQVVDQGAVIPVVHVIDEQRATAGWRPMIDDGLGASLAIATAAMPPVLTMLHPEVAPWQITSTLLEQFVDDGARVRLYDSPAGGPGPRQRSDGAVAARRVLGALVGDGLLALSPEVVAIGSAIGRWTDGVSGRSPLTDVQVTVRISAPGPDDEAPGAHTDDVDDTVGSPSSDEERHGDPERPWVVELLVAPLDDLSLMVPGGTVWNDDQVTGLAVEPARRALRAVGRLAQRRAPALAERLDPQQPWVAELTLDDAIEFMRNEAHELESSGVRVLLPQWWNRPHRAGVRATVSSAPVTDSGLTAHSLTEVDWSVVLDGVVLSNAELTQLAQAKHEVVKVRGRWVAFERDQVAKALTALTTARRDRSQLDPVALVTLGADPEVEIDATGWAAELLAGLPDDRLEAVTEPDTFHGELRPYQRRGLGWLAFLHRLGLGGCLADDMGLGKTAQLLALLLHERSHGAVGPTLVVCPLSVVRNWQLEAQRFAPSLTVHVHHGSDRSDTVQPADLVITTYATASRDVAALSAISWERLVADEAQHVKNPHANAARALRRIPARHKLALTGTPVENRLADLWALFHLVSPGLLGSADTFRQRYAVPIERHRDAEVTARLQRIVTPFLLRRSKADRSLVPELPPKIEQTAWASLTREQASLYKAVADDLTDRLEHLDGMDRRGAILAAITKLKQICNHPAQLLRDGSRLAGRSGKLARFDELVDDALAADEQVLVFTQFATMGTLLQRHLLERQGLKVPFLSGSVAKSRRDTMVDRFQNGSGGPLLLVSLKAGGSGLNLTAASQVIHYDRWWNPAVEDQASDRAWRIGQRSTVVVHKLVCKGTIEARVDELITAKRELADRVVGSGEGWLTELSTDDLVQVIALRSEEDR